MMLQGAPPGLTNNPGDSPASTQPHDTAPTVSSGGGAELAGSGGSGFSEDERGRIDDGGRNSGGNRWPRQETLALLKIRSDMDVAFRDSSLKGPLWDEVSRKLAELGYHRSAKKCKEKFENVYKYHKRTKEGRTSKADGKTYRFFDQLQALEGSPAHVMSHHQHQQQQQQSPSTQHQHPVVAKPVQVSPMPNTQVPSVVIPTNVPNATRSHQNNVDPISVAAPAVTMPATMNINHVAGFPFSQLNLSVSTNSSSSSTSSDDDVAPERRRNKKRKWKEFFGKLMKEVIDKQEELQSKFLDSLERRERDRMAREEAWRMQEMAKMKREHDLLVQERSKVAAKDAAVISFLQKITEQNPSTVIPQMPAMQLLQQQQQNRPPQPPPPQPQPTPSMQQSQPPQQQQQQPQLHVQTQQQQPPQQASLPLAVPIHVPIPVSVPATTPPPPAVKTLDNGGGGESMLQPSPSRWPKAEINALIKLRTTLDTKYQESGPKGPLWEEISSAMKKLGYNRNAKRCKEKWENINKYYKKVKESSKKRPEDSKTCPYFHQLDAIYREKAGNSSNNNSNINPGFGVKPETQLAAPIMARPEQQWPHPSAGAVQERPHQHQNPYQQQQQQQHQHQHQHQQQQGKPNEPTGNEEQHNDDDDEYDDDEEEDDDDEEGGEYEIVPNKTSSMAAVE